MKTISEQLLDLENTRAAKAARMSEVMQKSVEEGRSSETAEGEEFDTLETEVKAIDADLVRLRKLEKLNSEKAKAVDGSDSKSASDSRSFAVAKTAEKLDPGIAFARYGRCLLLSKGNVMQAQQIALNQYPQMEGLQEIMKAAVAGGNTTDTTWAAPLVQYQQYAGDFIEYLRPQTILGKFGAGGIPSLNRVPFNVTISGQTSGGTADWVGEQAPKPLTKFDFVNVNLRWAKIASIAVISEELARMSNPSAESLVRNALASAVIARMDTDFIDPDKAVVANVSPASMTNGVTPIVSTGGNSAEEIRADIRALFASWISNNVNPANAVFIMSPGAALALSLMYNSIGSAREFPGISMNGGTLEGIPVIVSQYAANDGGSAGSLVILINASDVYLADDGQVMLDVSREASLQMDSAPTNPPVAATVMVSMFQTNQIAIRAERYINWAKRRASAVAYLDSVSWGT